MSNFDESSGHDEPPEREEPQAGKAELKTKVLRILALLRARLGDDVVTCWFGSLDIEEADAKSVRFTVPVKFLRSWIQSHYGEDLLACCKQEFPGIERVEVQLRQPVAKQPAGPSPAAIAAAMRTEPPAPLPRLSDRRPVDQPASTGVGRNSANGLEGSPLDPRCTFQTFEVGPSNRMAHAAAVQAAETVFSEDRGFNPLFLHSSVGLGKTHLLHAIAWEVKRRTPHAQVLYLTAERFLFQFVEAIRSQDAIAFKNKFRNIDILLIDDFEFMHGDKTETEFEHILNMMLDAGRQLIVARRAAGQIDRPERPYGSRLQRGLVTELQPLNAELRLKILERRVFEKRAQDPLFAVEPEILTLLSERLVENGRELEGATTTCSPTGR